MLLFELCKLWGGNGRHIHPDYLRPDLTERQLREWENFYEQEPWGESRADLRQAASIAIWGAMLAGGSKKPPSPMFPYWEEQERLDPKQIDEWTANFANAIEPKPGGGYQYTAEALKRMKELGQTPDGDDNRQAELHGDSRR